MGVGWRGEAIERGPRYTLTHIIDIYSNKPCKQYVYVDSHIGLLFYTGLVIFEF